MLSEHVAGIAAESLYEAGALALHQFQRSEWSRETSLDTGTLRVEVCECTFYISKSQNWRRGSNAKVGRQETLP
jgi:hypothetical protein